MLLPPSATSGGGSSGLLQASPSGAAGGGKGKGGQAPLALPEPSLLAKLPLPSALGDEKRLARALKTLGG